MSTHPIGDRAMTAGERSARNQAKIRQDFNMDRTILRDNANFMLKIGKKLMADGEQKLAHEALMNAEICTNQVKNINKRLINFEHEFTDWAEPPAPRNGFIKPDPRKGLVFDPNNLTEGQRKQKEYEAKRSAARPEIAARYGHLAKAEKAEATE